jgi:NitT/TauT family transport system ATP-binding protein
MTRVPAISFDRVSKIFTSASGKATEALHDLTFEIPANEFLAIVGPSGCGKSTVLRLAAGLIPPTAGTVSLDAIAVTGPADRVGIVFQKPTLLPWLDVLSNVTFPLKHKYGRVQDSERQRARDLISLVGLTGFERNRPDELSGGMQQRAAIARALLLDPEILLMDEPFSALDALTRDEMSFELQRIWMQNPKTVIFITHSIPEAVLLADRILVMTPRPGMISEVVDIPLARPRTTDTMLDPNYHALTARIRGTVLKQHRAA